MPDALCSDVNGTTVCVCVCITQTDYPSEEEYTAAVRDIVKVAVSEARSEAKLVCGDKLGHVFVEKFSPGKHIEVQIAIGLICVQKARHQAHSVAAAL